MLKKNQPNIKTNKNNLTSDSMLSEAALENVKYKQFAVNGLKHVNVPVQTFNFIFKRKESLQIEEE